MNTLPTHPAPCRSVIGSQFPVFHRGLRITLVLALLAPLSACTKKGKPVYMKPPQGQAESQATPAEEDSTASSQLPVLGEISSFTLTDQFGRPSGSQELYGNLCIVHFMFTSCTATCPVQMSTLAELSRSLKTKAGWNYTRLVSVSVDPKDTPEILKSYAGKYCEENDPHWVFLGGSEEVIQTLAKGQFHLPAETQAPATDTPILHSQTFVLLDPVGRIRGYYNSLDSAEVTRLANDYDQVWSEQVPFLPEIMNPAWLPIRQEAQLATATDIQVEHDFQFTDRRQESGIRFLNEIVDDAKLDYKGVHYDHGNGLVIGDIDGDGLTDLYFTNQTGRNELWKNLGNGTFQDITDRAGVGVADRVSVSASMADIDNDGDLDLYVTAVRKGNLLFRNDGTGVFEDISETSGLDYQGHSSGALFFDYDRDGLLDLFLCNVGVYTTDAQGNSGYYVGFKDAFSGHLKPERTELSRLYRNLGDSKFEDVTEALGLSEGSWTGDAGIIDANRDGWPDLYVLDMQGNDEYYENLQGQGFKKRSRELFPGTPWGAMGLSIFDFDNDGDFDIYVSDMHSDMSKNILPDSRSEVSLHTFYEEEYLKATMQLPESLLKSEGASIFGNAFFRNDGPDRFTEISDEVGAEIYWPWGTSTGDLNADGYEDVFVAASMNYPYRYGINSVLLNENGQRFRSAEFILGVEPRQNYRTARPWFPFNCGDQPAEAIDKALMEKVCGNRQDSVVVWGSVGSRSSVIFDIDNDGDLDIVTNEFNDVPLVLVSNLSDRRLANYLKIRLQGTVSNRQAIGTAVTVRTATRQLPRWYDGKTGYLSQGAPDMYVGLGAETSAEAIEVTWPSGSRQTLEGPFASGQTIEITEPAAGAPGN